MVFSLKWKGEIIESEIETLKEAKYLQSEYQMAYGGIVKIMKE